MDKIYFTITGTNHRYGQEFFESGMSVDLEKEPDNEYDKWATWQTARTPCAATATVPAAFTTKLEIQLRAPCSTCSRRVCSAMWQRACWRAKVSRASPGRT